jgi:hypothetical protein
MGMKRRTLQEKTGDSEDEYQIVEWRVIAVWNDGLVEDWSGDLADDSTLAMEVESYCVNYEDLRNTDPQDYNATEW